MKFKTILTLFIIFISFSLLSVQQSYSQGFPLPDSDHDGSGSGGDGNFGLTAFFDLRERESFVQVTNNDDMPLNLHVQIFNVANLCNENDFFDAYTINDTHVYNLRDILTNDGNPSGVVLPDNSYGIVVITAVNEELSWEEGVSLFGNFRVLDNSGYEYRTNMSGWNEISPGIGLTGNDVTFNFSQQAGITFSDIVGIYLVDTGFGGSWHADNITRTFMVMDVDIFDLNENPLSCRDVAFACVQPDSSFVDEILAYDGGDGGEFGGTNGANVASFEYGINNAIPHSKGGELLCPGNNIEDGFVKMNMQGAAFPTGDFGGDWIVNVFVGLNNGNGRGSMDAVWWNNSIIDR